jgi:hypothetical protein
MNDDADGAIIVCVSLMVGSTILRHRLQSGKPVRLGHTIAYGFFLAFALMILAMPFPKFARALSYLGLAGAFAVNAPEIFKWAGGTK